MAQNVTVALQKSIFDVKIQHQEGIYFFVEAEKKKTLGIVAADVGWIVLRGACHRGSGLGAGRGRGGGVGWGS